ncbi:hypothetical protein IW261DRAFT_1540501 [Armillaria novae-zelandiae]|uniref:Uncharacterized protein n=1 Tax=Armillaria novae-zelandiae TaxID=153914 RepID=A0AA39KE10_9AGAR|nr:hypothetical protein IW261DRAFT_1540501 [Armillaria novae-zelandiae]
MTHRQTKTRFWYLIHAPRVFLESLVLLSFLKSRCSLAQRRVPDIRPVHAFYIARCNLLAITISEPFIPGTIEVFYTQCTCGQH